MTSFITGQVSSTEASPTTTPSLNAGYFDNTKFSTPTTSRAPSVASEEAARPAPFRTATDAIPALMRDFPKPTQELDVTAALARNPGRWTFQGQMEANERRAKLAALNNIEAAKVKRTEDFEAAKRELLASFQTASSERPQGPPRPTTTL